MLFFSKKNRFFFAALLIGSCLAGVYFFSLKPAQISKYCAFCDIKVLDAQKFYEDELVMALYTHKPILPGHCLIIPKRHVQRFEELTDQEIEQMGKVIKKVDRSASKIFETSSYLLLQKNGIEVGQTVPHVHFHYIPRKEGDYSVFGFLLKMYIACAKGPISKSHMDWIVKSLKEDLIPKEMN